MKQIKSLSLWIKTKVVKVSNELMTTIELLHECELVSEKWNVEQWCVSNISYYLNITSLMTLQTVT